jgi:hypothetical protein
MRSLAANDISPDIITDTCFFCCVTGQAVTIKSTSEKKVPDNNNDNIYVIIIIIPDNNNDNIYVIIIIIKSTAEKKAPFFASHNVFEYILSLSRAFWLIMPVSPNPKS